MKIYIGSDHNGFRVRNSLVDYIKRAGYAIEDEGDERLDPDDDFPIFAQKVVSQMLVAGGENARGILICGSGQGMCMAANRFKGIRAALGYDRESIVNARNDDDANVLCLPAKSLDLHQINIMVETFLNTPFVGAPRYKRRIAELDNLT